MRIAVVLAGAVESIVVVVVVFIAGCACMVVVAAGCACMVVLAAGVAGTF